MGSSTEAKATRGKNVKKAHSGGRTRITRPEQMKVSAERLVEAARRSNGLLSAVAMMLNIDRRTVARYLEVIPEAKAEFEDARESIVDVMESKFLKILQDEKHPRHVDALFFGLDRLAKKRGYTTRIEQEISGELKGAAPALNIVIEK